MRMMNAVPGATTVHGSNAAKAALDAVSDGSEPFPSTAPARLEFLAAHNPQVVQSILAHVSPDDRTLVWICELFCSFWQSCECCCNCESLGPIPPVIRNVLLTLCSCSPLRCQHQAVLAHAAAMESSQHGAHAASLILGGSQHGPSSFGGSQHGANNFGGSQHGANNFGSSQHGTNNYGSSQHGANNYGASQHGGTSFSMETSQHGAAHLGSVERSQHGPVSANFPQTSQGQGLVVNTSPQTTVIHVQQQISPGHPQQKQPSSLATNTAAEDPFNWCPQTTSFEDDIFKNDP